MAEGASKHYSEAGSAFGLGSARGLRAVGVRECVRPYVAEGGSFLERRAMKEYLAVVIETTLNTTARIFLSRAALLYFAGTGLVVLAGLNGAALGQGVLSGSATFSGSSQFSPSSGPLTYSARTDNCVTGAESGCISGATTGEAGSAVSFQLRPTDSIPSGFAGTTINYRLLSFWPDSIFLSRLLPCADELDGHGPGFRGLHGHGDGRQHELSSIKYSVCVQLSRLVGWGKRLYFCGRIFSRLTQ